MYFINTYYVQVDLEDRTHFPINTFYSAVLHATLLM